MPKIKTGDLRDRDFKERGKPGKKAKPVISRDLTNADIDRVRTQGKENGKETEQPEIE